MAEFFSKNLRFRKNAKKTPLQTCWCAATIKNFSSSGSKEIDLVDVAAVCDELKNKFLETQGKSRCSLYLASQLMFGAVKVFQAQTDSCLKDSQNLCESFFGRAEMKKKKMKRKDNKHVEDNSSSVEASPKIPEIPEIDIFSILEKDSAKDVNLIEEMDFPPDYKNDLSFDFSNDAEGDDVAMEEEFNCKVQRILRQEKNIPPRHSTDSTLHETQHISDNENVVMDQDQIPLNENDIHNDMRQKLQKTPIRKARPILANCDINESTPASARAAPLSSKVPSLPQSPIFVMSPVFGKRKRPLSALGRDATIMEPIAEAALPTDSPQQSRLPMECATPPRLFTTSLGEHQAFVSPSGNSELPDRQPNIQHEQEKESSFENDEAVKSTLGNKSISLPAEDESSVKSLSQNLERSQKVTVKSTDNNARRRAKKRIFQDSEKELDDRDFAKRLKNINYSIKKKEKVLITSAISSQSSAARFLFTLPSVLQKHHSISNRLMQLYEQDIRVLKKSAKELESRHSSQQSENQTYNQRYNEAEIPHQSPAEAVVEENMDPPQINQYFEDDGMMPQDNNVLNKQRFQVQTDVQTDYVNETEVQDNIPDSAVATSSIPVAGVNSSQTVAASVGTVLPSASLNKENEQVFHNRASPCIPIQTNPSQFFELSQTAQINEVSEEVDDRQQESDQVLHPSAKRFKVGETDLGIDSTVQNLKTISFLSLTDFYARVEKYWNEADKLNKRINGKVIAVFQEVVSPECSNLYEVLKYLIYCFMLERKRKMDLLQQTPRNPLYILQRK